MFEQVDVISDCASVTLATTNPYMYQMQVDRGVTLSEGLLRHDKRLEKKGIKNANFPVFTCSNWDCRVKLESVDRGVTLSEGLLRHDKRLEKKGIKNANFPVFTCSNWDCRVKLESLPAINSGDRRWLMAAVTAVAVVTG
ncbi:hypothetical protein CTI12_AA453840 [Artemisia annua]|uniref:Uncharacterized protein n=1 Tax=Artemisia annua TaxID=35608 RepID=A0A2U1LUB5_ARTAN|nr:hypothetical protein CTI12_AA453840 [Artemisia annua]